MISDDFFANNLQEKNIIENFGEFFASRAVLTSTERDDGMLKKKTAYLKSTLTKITAPRFHI